MNQSKLINELQSSNLFAECSHCGGEFKLSDAILFDGYGAFPTIAEQKRQEWLQELKERMDKLKKRKLYADVGAEKKAIDIGVGKIIEKILPAYKEFKISLFDCRPLFEPVDYIIFNGATNMNVDAITFLEIKTGKSRLNKHERMIRDAVVDKKLRYEAV